MAHIVASTPARSRKNQRRKPAVAPASRVVQPLPAPGETAVVGLCDWDAYLGLDKALEKRGYRVRYFEGLLEIMSISFKHEALKAHIGRLVEAFCLWAGIDFQVWGSTTQRKEGVAGGEPDESYTFGLEPKDKPELVIEVALTSGGIDKLEFWRTLGAQEVWIWQNNRLHAFVRTASDDAFQPASSSRFLPSLPLALVEKFASVEPTSQAVREFRKSLESLPKA
jgi:Uma2 family endonuclease